MGLALDEPRDGDHRYEIDDLLWVIAEDQTELTDPSKGFRVDYRTSWGRSGFVVSRVGATGCC